MNMRTSFTPPGDMIAVWLDGVMNRWGQDRFISGDCHNLALALMRAAGHQGSLAACIRTSFNPDGSIFSTCMSHLVYVDVDGGCWDIDGCDADFRWEDQFEGLDEPDKWGMTGSLEWVDVQRTPPNYKDTIDWLGSFGMICDLELQQQLVDCLVHPAVASLPPAHGAWSTRHKAGLYNMACDMEASEHYGIKVTGVLARIQQARCYAAGFMLR